MPFAYTKSETAERMGVSIRTVTNLITRGDLESYRVGRRVFVSEAMIEAFFAKARRVAPPSSTPRRRRGRAA